MQVSCFAISQLMGCNCHNSTPDVISLLCTLEESPCSWRFSRQDHAGLTDVLRTYLRIWIEMLATAFGITSYMLVPDVRWLAILISRKYFLLSHTHTLSLTHSLLLSLSFSHSLS